MPLPETCPERAVPEWGNLLAGRLFAIVRAAGDRASVARAGVTRLSSGALPDPFRFRPRAVRIEIIAETLAGKDI